MPHLDSELYIASRRRARLSCEGREYDHEGLSLDGDLCQRLLELELEQEPESYGTELFDAVLPAGSRLREGLREALARARSEGLRLHLRLHLASKVPADLHALRWELLFDTDCKAALGRSPDTAFSRYSTVSHDPGRPVSGRPRLLVLVAAPTDAPRFQMAPIDRAQSHQRLAASFEDLGMDFEILEPPATLGRLRERLSASGIHALHVFGHGLARRRRSSCLVLENDDGTARFVEESLLAETFLGNRELRLVTLIACHGGVLSSNDAFSGLAARLVERGLPAVIAMSRAVTFDTAHLFTDHLYRGLARTGRVDEAVNEARQQVYLADPKSVAWSSPMLYMRLPGGCLWEAENEAERPAAVVVPQPVTIVEDPRPLSWFRQAALALVTLMLGLAVWPASTVETDLDLLVGSVSFKLAEKQPVIDRFHLSELATSFLQEILLPRSLGHEPNPVRGSELRKPLGMILRADAPASTVTLQQTIVPAGKIVAFEHLEAKSYRLSIDKDNAGEPGREEDVEMSVAIGGRVRFKMLHERPTSLGKGAPETIFFQPLNGKAELDVVFAELKGTEFVRSLTISGLRLFEVEEKSDGVTTFFKEISTIRSGSAVLTSSGIRHQLKENEELRFAELSGALYKIEPRDDGIALGFHGSVASLETQVPGGSRLRPTILGLWMGAGVGQALLAAAALLLATFLLTTIRASLRYYAGMGRGRAAC